MGRYVRTALKERKKEAVTGALVTCLLKLTQTVKFKLKKKNPFKKGICGVRARRRGLCACLLALALALGGWDMEEWVRYMIGGTLLG